MVVMTLDTLSSKVRLIADCRSLTILGSLTPFVQCVLMDLMVDVGLCLALEKTATNPVNAVNMKTQQIAH